MTNKYSYTAADSFPLKLAQDYDVIKKIVKHKYVSPIHIQLIPTNQCTRNCSYCSCANRDKSLSLSLKEIKFKMKQFQSLGGKSVTITGGGDPLAHPHINEIIEVLYRLGFKIGLVTNGDLIKSVEQEKWAMVNWCRISCSDASEFSQLWWGKIAPVVNLARKVDWAFSYVVTKNHKPNNLNKYIREAKRYNFTHVRIVTDLLDYENVSELSQPFDDIVIYQSRKEPRKGVKECWISLLKPVLAADGNLYPCCGVQYAEKKMGLDFTKSMRMKRDIFSIWEEQKPFDGTICDRCYYTEYNEFLGGLLSNLNHREFV